MRVIIYKNRESLEIRHFHVVPDAFSEEEITRKCIRWNEDEKNDLAVLHGIPDGSFEAYLIRELEDSKEADMDAVKSALYDLSQVETFLESLLSR